MRAALTLVAFLACGDAYLSDSIEAGLRPHHATGASVEDPLLFRHQFQDHDDSGRLVYYQYEARRHAHVVMLDDFGVQSCTAAPVDANVTIVTLQMRSYEAPPSTTARATTASAAMARARLVMDSRTTAPTAEP